jgi:hypothetical protein
VGVEVVFGVAVSAGAGMIVVVVVTCCTSTAGSAGCDRGIVSVSRSSSEARNFAIAFRARSGNGPERVCAQFCSIRASCASIFSTEFISSSVSVDDAAGFLLEQVGTAVGAVAAVGFAMTGVCVAVTRCSRIFFAAFRQMSSMAVRGSDDGYNWAEGLGADNKY